MKGYLNNQKATEETIQDGWLHSGDIAYYDEMERFFIVDRLKELIKVKGFQVPPAELEDLIRSHEDVLDVAVIGIQHERKGNIYRSHASFIYCNIFVIFRPSYSRPFRISYNFVQVKFQEPISC